MATKTGTDSGSVFSETGGSRTIHRSKGSVFRVAVTRFGTVGAFVVMIVYFEIASSGLMLRTQNIGSILNQSAPLGLLSIGLTLCLILGLFDLSIGYTGTLAGMVCTGLMLNQGVAWPLASLVFDRSIQRHLSAGFSRLWSVQHLPLVAGVGACVRRRGAVYVDISREDAYRSADVRGWRE